MEGGAQGVPSSSSAQLLLPEALAVGFGCFGSEQADTGVSLLALLMVVFALGSPFLGSLPWYAKCALKLIFLSSFLVFFSLSNNFLPSETLYLLPHPKSDPVHDQYPGDCPGRCYGLCHGHARRCGGWEALGTADGQCGLLHRGGRGPDRCRNGAQWQWPCVCMCCFLTCDSPRESSRLCVQWQFVQLWLVMSYFSHTHIYDGMCNPGIQFITSVGQQQNSIPVRWV